MVANLGGPLGLWKDLAVRFAQKQHGHQTGETSQAYTKHNNNNGLHKKLAHQNTAKKSTHYTNTLGKKQTFILKQAQAKFEHTLLKRTHILKTYTD